MSKALYRKYRSKNLLDIIGQKHVTDVLERAIKTKKVAHAYLLTGPRGVGKTSIARILAHEINDLPYAESGEYLDIIEIDAASNNSVEDVRGLREKALIAPANAAKKVYIIDEVHMLSKSAFNALLKILEEPPEHIVFILATTDYDKLPATIISRTQKFNFRFVTTDEVAKRLRFIADQEKIKIDDEAINLIAQQGGGSVRDSISLLDQLQHSSEGTITENIVEKSLNMASRSDLVSIYNGLKKQDPKGLISLVDKLISKGISSTTLSTQLATELQKHLLDDPSLITKIESLLEIGKSSHPDVRLMVVLVSDMNKSQSVAKEKTKNVSSYISKQSDSIKIPEKDMVRESQKPRYSHDKPVDNQTESTQEAVDDSPQTSSTNHKDLDEKSFNWEAVIDISKKYDTVIYTMLNKCTPRIEDGKLILYAGKIFHKKRLDDSKQKSKIFECLSQAGYDNIRIETKGTPPPPRSESAAKIVAMMGGGEEIDV